MFIGSTQEGEASFLDELASRDSCPIFFLGKVAIEPGDTAETLAMRVNEREHFWQPRITDLIVNEKITWDGKHRDSLQLPQNYSIEQ